MDVCPEALQITGEEIYLPTVRVVKAPHPEYCDTSANKSEVQSHTSREILPFLLLSDNTWFKILVNTTVLPATIVLQSKCKWTVEMTHTCTGMKAGNFMQCVLFWLNWCLKVIPVLEEQNGKPVKTVQWPGSCRAKGSYGVNSKHGCCGLEGKAP